MDKKVTFHPEEPVSVHTDPLDMQEDLKKYRTSTLFQRMVDKMRMEKTLSPVLCHEHRKRVLDCLFPPLSPQLNALTPPPSPSPRKSEKRSASLPRLVHAQGRSSASSSRRRASSPCWVSSPASPAASRCSTSAMICANSSPQDRKSVV